jgi:PAS domain S-box-containing protein
MDNTILYVDDEEINLVGFKAVFRKTYTIHTASNTTDAHTILNTNEIQVLIIDQRMPQENGLDFLKRIRPLFPNLVFIILTAYSDIENVMQAINQGGVFRYLLKPWDKNEMQMAIDSAIRTYNLQKENQLLIEALKIKNDELQKSEEKFRNIFNDSVDSIIITDLVGNFIDINQITIEKTGISKEKFLTMSLFDLVDENADQVKNYFDNPAKEQLALINSSYINPKTNQRVYLETRSRIIFFDNQNAILHIARDVTDRVNLEKKLLKTIIETEEAERSRVARELHDGVSPVLAATRLYAQSFATGRDKNLEPLILQKLEETIDEAIQSITEISNNLSPHILQNFGLVIGIDNFIKKLKNSRNIDFSFSSTIPERLPLNIETTLYRITVELITNTIKYAKASEVTIVINHKNGIDFTYTDNGCGFNTEVIEKHNKGMGFYNIMSRIKTLNGTVSIKSEIGMGMTMQISIPDIYNI